MSEEAPLSKKHLREKLRKLFETSKSQTGQQNLIEAAKKLYNKQNDYKEFLQEFIDVLKYCLVYPDKTAADRMLIFVSKFTASLYSYKALIHDSDEPEDDVEHPFVNGLFDFLFQTHSATLVDVRLRCTTLINYILTALPDDSWLPFETWNGLAETTRSRLQDRNCNVRVAAVLVARKLQEPKDPKCEIVKLLSFHMTDPAPAVRRAVISSIALSKVTIVDVLERTLDVNENVRRNAFVVIAKVRFQSLTISQRVTLLERGLKDRAERVQSCIRTVVIAQWLDQVNNNVLTLMEGLDVVNCAEVVALALDAVVRVIPVEEMMKALPLDADARIIPEDQLCPETALLWRFLVQYLSRKGMDDILDQILPNVSIFTKLIESYYPLEVSHPLQLPLTSSGQWEEVKRKRVLIHLLELASAFDLCDEMGRLNLRKLILSMLTCPRTGSQLADNLVDLLRVIVPDTEEFLGTLMETISDIREPLNQVVVERPKEEKLKLEFEISGYKVALNELRENEYAAAQSKNYAEAAKLNAQIEEISKKITELNVLPPTTLCEVREEKNDPETVCKCLAILVKMVPVSGAKELTPGLRYLSEDFLNPCLTSEDLLTQSLAIQALAQFCILDKTMAQDHLLSFLFMLSENGENEINIPALKAVFDILQTHGTNCFEKLKEEGDRESPKDANNSGDNVNCSQIGNAELGVPAAKCIAVLKELLNCTANDELKRTAFEGFCKLLLTGVIYSPSLLKSIIIKGFTPIRGNESEDRIRQLFMVFFPLFARNTTRSQEMIETAFIPVMRVLNDAQLGSAEADINHRDVATFLIDHTKPGTNRFTSPTVHVHNTLALSICHEILRDATLCADLGHDHNYLRGLLQLNLSLESESYKQQVLTLLAKMKREIQDSTSIRLIKQLQIKLMESSGGAASLVQNTLESIRTDIDTSTMGESRNNHSSLPPASSSSPPKTVLDCVPETCEDLSIMESSTSSEPAPPIGSSTFSAVVVAESPEISDESDLSE